MKNKRKIKSCLTSLSIAILLIATMPQFSANTEEHTNNNLQNRTLTPDLNYAPTTHDFGTVLEGNEYQTTFNIWNAGTGTLTWSLGIVNTWLMPNPMSGSSTGENDTVTVRINTTDLSPGPYSGAISISANDGGGLRYFTVSFVVLDTAPPTTPSQLNGPSSGQIGEVLLYTTSSTDPDGDNIVYGLDMNNDGNIDHWSNYSYPSGFTYQIGIRFWNTGVFALRILAKDTHGAMSDFSPPKIVTISGTGNNEPITPPAPTGPNIGNTGISYTFTINTTDPDDDDIRYGWDWDGDGSVDEWSGLLSSGTNDVRSHSYAVPGTYQIKVIAEDEHGAQSSFSMTKTIIINSNQPPNKPSISGPSTGEPDRSYLYTASCTDDNEDQIYYWFDWGDGTNTGWVGPYNSGQNASESHIWNAQGTYSVKVKTKDTNGAETVWSDPIPVSMPKNKKMLWLDHLLESFPLLNKLFNGYF